MECFVHTGRPAVGICAICGRAVCRDCHAPEQPGRLICTTCHQNPVTRGYEYRSAAEFAGLPLIHVCAGVDPVTNRPRVAKGIIAVGNIAVGGVAVGGVSLGLFSIGGLSVGVLAALGGVAVGAGLSLGGLAVGSVAVGGLALGATHAIGGAAFGPHAISATRCDPETQALVARWLGSARICR